MFGLSFEMCEEVYVELGDGFVGVLGEAWRSVGHE